MFMLSFGLLAQHENKQQLANLEIEHLNHEMLQQLAYRSLLDRWTDIDNQTTVSFSFPNGEAVILINKQNTTRVELIVTTTSSSNTSKNRKYLLQEN